MKKSILTFLFLILILGGLVLFFQSQKQNSQSLNGFLYYKDSKGDMNKIELPSSFTGVKEIYYTGSENKTIYGVEYGLSGEIKIYEDLIDVAKNLSEVIPPKEWQPAPSGHQLTLRLYKLFQLIERGEGGKDEIIKPENDKIYDVYNFFQSPNDSPLKECFQKPYENVEINPSLKPYMKDVCKEPVPTNLIFGIHDKDFRYVRLRYSILYKAYKEKDITACETLLKTEFPLDKKEDVVASYLNNFLLCKSLAQGDVYTKDDIPFSEAIRRMSYRLTVALGHNKCGLYDDKRVEMLCNGLREYIPHSIQGVNLSTN